MTGKIVSFEVCQILEKTKALPRKERIKALCDGENSGRWSALTGGTVTKRIAQLEYDTALKSYPIPFSTSVQDRAVVEIRRGCGRMCRFCQPGHVTLPIRERSAEDIIKIAKELHLFAPFRFNRAVERHNHPAGMLPAADCARQRTRHVRKASGRDKRRRFACYV